MIFRLPEALTKRVVVLLAVAVAATLAFTAHAQPWSVPSSLYSSYYPTLPGPWATAGTKLSHATRVPGAGLAVVDVHGFASRSVLSWRPSSYYGAEIGYQPLPQHVFQPFAASMGKSVVERATMPVTLNAYAPLANRTEFIGRFGYLLNSGQGNERFCFDASGRAYGCQDTPLTFGVGVRYEMRERLGLRIDLDVLDHRDASFGPRNRSSFFSLGADYRY